MSDDAKEILITEDDRLNFMARYGISLHVEYTGPSEFKWYMNACFHTKIHCVDDHTRFDDFRQAIDAAIVELIK